MKMKFKKSIFNQKNLGLFPNSKRSTPVSSRLSDIRILSDSKRSQAHVEMIISFVIFLGALIFIFVFINPVKERTKDNSIEEIQKAILREIIQDIGKMSVIVNSSSDCYDIPKLGNKFIEIKDAERKYTLYYNLSDTPAVPSCSVLGGRNFTTGVYSREKFIVQKKVVDFVNMYNSDYLNLKNSIGSGKDFSFSLRKINGNIINDLSVSRNIPAGINVNAKEFPVQVINSSAGIDNLMLNVKTW